MINVQNITYHHQNRDLLFEDINLNVSDTDKIALIGNNGTGKSTLLKIIAGILLPSVGNVFTDSTPYYMPQLFGQFNHYTVAQALRIDAKLNAFHQILDGNSSEECYNILNDDWTIEERSRASLAYWGLDWLELDRKMETLSGGQQTKVFLSGINIHQPKIILLDEPSNHLDSSSRLLLYKLIQIIKNSLLVVSHDRKLLNMLDPICELTPGGINVYGGNYEFYTEQKKIELNSIRQSLKFKEKELKQVKLTEKETMERQNRSNSRGKGKQVQSGLPKIMLKKYKDNAEHTTSKAKEIHEKKISGISEELSELRKTIPKYDKMKFEFDNSNLHKGKILVKGNKINYSYNDQNYLWDDPIDFTVLSGERILLTGKNGSGKTTLIKIILGELMPIEGETHRGFDRAVYIDQDYSLIDDNLTVYEQALIFNATLLQEHEIKIRLYRFLFNNDDWNKSCSNLSGGEKIRLMLCCLNIYNQAPDIIILDEPTNNLDIQNIEILTNAINDYKGTLIVVSHDEFFVNRINIERNINLISTEMSD